MDSKLPITVEDFGDEVRFSEDGRISVLDGIKFITKTKNPRSSWNRLSESHPDVVAKCDNVPLADSRGRKNKPSPVANLQVFLEIVVILPGRLAAQVREEAVRTLVRAMNGDVSLVEEIIDRIKNPQDLKRIELRAKAAQSNKYLNSKIQEHGGLSNAVLNGRRYNTYAQIANMNNFSIKGKTAKEIQLSENVKQTRDAFTNAQLARIEFQEVLEATALDTRDSQGHFEIVSTVKDVIADINQLVKKYTAS